MRPWHTQIFLALTAITIASSSVSAEEVSIAEVQGTDHRTHFPKSTPIEISGVVTAHFGKGLFIQSLSPDDDSASSEGIYAFTGSLPSEEIPSVGKTVKVTGRPEEFQPFPELPIRRKRDVAVCGTTNIKSVYSEDRRSFLSITELTGIDKFVITGTAPLPEPILFEPPGASQPIAFADIPDTIFNAKSHPRDYLESLEGMRVKLANAIVVSRKEPRWDQFWVIPSAFLGSDEVSSSGLPLSRADHIFPEIISVHKAKNQPPIALEVGTRLGDITGIMTYENGNYIVVLDNVINADALPIPTLPMPATMDFGTELRIASYNAENLSISGRYAAAKLSSIAKQIVEEIQSPSIIGLQEIQDDDGQGATALVTAQKTLKALANAIIDAGGPEYTPIGLDPVLPNTDGGAPGGNIRNAFLLREDAAVTVNHSERLFDDESRCNSSINPFAQSRKPVLLDANVGDARYVLINVHLSSKLGDEGLYSKAEAPKPKSLERRQAQAEFLVRELERRYETNPPMIILMGDFNDHKESLALAPFLSSSLNFGFVPDHRGERFTVSYAFNGIREAIDHFVVGGNQNANVSATYLNLNADTLEQVSDHNPVVLSIQ